MKLIPESKTTWISCDNSECRHGSGSDRAAAKVTFYEICLESGEQTDVWYGTPPKWLSMIDRSGSIVYVCTEECALELTNKIIEFWIKYNAKHKETLNEVSEGTKTI